MQGSAIQQKMHRNGVIQADTMHFKILVFVKFMYFSVLPRVTTPICCTFVVCCKSEGPESPYLRGF